MKHGNAQKYRGGCNLQAIYPAESIIKYSDVKTRLAAKNSVSLNMKIMNEGNSKPFHSAIAATRIGYSLDSIIENLKETALDRPLEINVGIRENHTTGPLHYNGEFIEFINSTMLQTNDEIVEVFPNWYKDKDAMFHGLRAKGAFIVSAAYKGGTREVENISVVSEKGKVLTIASPWGEHVRVTDSHGNCINASVVTPPTKEMR